MARVCRAAPRYWAYALLSATLLAGCTPVHVVLVGGPTQGAIGAGTPAPGFSPVPLAATGAPATPSATASPTPYVRPKPAHSPPTRIVAPTIELDAPVVPVGWEVDAQGVSRWQTAGNAAGWHITSAYPGQPGNVVLSGHNNTQGEVFRDLTRFKPGDEIILYAESQVYLYRVQEWFIVPEREATPEQQQQNARWAAPTRDERLTLISCWPFRTNTHRIIVIARPVLSAAQGDALGRGPK
jgi:sortase A